MLVSSRKEEQGEREHKTPTETAVCEQFMKHGPTFSGKPLRWKLLKPL